VRQTSSHLRPNPLDRPTRIEGGDVRHESNDEQEINRHLFSKMWSQKPTILNLEPADHDFLN
jgi:hypothetical protein